MPLSTYGRGQILNHVLRSGTFTKPTGIYIALFTAGDTELSGPGYARVQHGPADDKWRDQTAGDGTSSNIGSISFANPTGAWGTATQFKVLDALTGGNVIGVGTLAQAKTINAADEPPNFPDGSLIVRFL